MASRGQASSLTILTNWYHEKDRGGKEPDTKEKATILSLIPRLMKTEQRYYGSVMDN